MGDKKRQRTEEWKAMNYIAWSYNEGQEKLQQRKFDGLKARGIIVEDIPRRGSAVVGNGMSDGIPLDK